MRTDPVLHPGLLFLLCLPRVLPQNRSKTLVGSGTALSIPEVW
jgi:hypothetical protein